MTPTRRALFAAPAGAFYSGAALAHASDRGFVLLLPTGHYLAGGAAAVALSFAALGLIPARRLEAFARWRLRLFELPPEGLRTATSLLSFCSLALLALAGFFGSRDPLDNPLPLTVWTIFWVGLALLQGTLGDFWSWLDPWAGLCRLAERFGLRPVLKLPARLGVAPAVALLFAVLWFELIDPAPDDPARLAAAVSAYWAATFLCMLLFGHVAWRARCEAFSVLFGMLARLGVTDAGGTSEEPRRLTLCLPAAKLWQAPPLPLSGTLFLLLALAGIAFDGLSKTFLYLGATGVNPLEHPGRSALVGVNTAGLLLTFAALAALFFAAVAAGRRLAGSAGSLGEAAGAMAWTLLPIALAYQFAHYLAALLVNAQYWLVSLSDPFETGQDLFGTAGMPVRAAVAAGSDAAWALWNAQAVAVVGAHLLGVLAAHGLARRLYPAGRQAMLFLVPLTVLMIFYTVFGLWLLSTPTGA